MKVQYFFFKKKNSIIVFFVRSSVHILPQVKYPFHSIIGFLIFITLISLILFFFSYCMYTIQPKTQSSVFFHHIISRQRWHSPSDNQWRHFATKIMSFCLWLLLSWVLYFFLWDCLLYILRAERIRAETRLYFWHFRVWTNLGYVLFFFKSI